VLLLLVVLSVFLYCSHFYSLLLSAYSDHRALHSFPTRRSSDLADFAAQGVLAGVYDIVIAAGVESMSRIPMLTSRIGQDPYGSADRKSTRLNSSHGSISYAVFCLKKKNNHKA